MRWWNKAGHGHTKESTKRTAEDSMGSDTEQEQADSVVTCPSSLDISQVQELHTKFNQVLEAGEPVLLDASMIERVDAAGLQLLCTFIQQAEVNELEVKWQEPSNALQESAKLLGLSDHLNFN